MVGKALDRVPRAQGGRSHEREVTHDRRPPCRGGRVLVCGGDVHVGVVWVFLRNQPLGCGGQGRYTRACDMTCADRSPQRRSSQRWPCGRAADGGVRVERSPKNELLCLERALKKILFRACSALESLSVIGACPHMFCSVAGRAAPTARGLGGPSRALSLKPSIRRPLPPRPRARAR